MVFGPLHTGQGADGKPPYKGHEEATKIPAHLLKDPPVTASVVHAKKATDHSRPETPGSTPRAQSRTQATSPKPPPVARNPEEQQVLDDVAWDSEDDSGMLRFRRDLRVVVHLSESAVTALLTDGLTSPLRLFQTAEAELDRLFNANPAITARDQTRLKCFRSLLLKELPSDLRNRAGIPTRQLLEDALNQQAKQAQAATVAESTLRRDALSEPPWDDRATARMPDMYDGDPKKWHEFKTSFTAYMMSQSLQYKHVLDHDEKRYDFPNRTGPEADANARDTHEDFTRYRSNHEVRNHKVFNRA